MAERVAATPTSACGELWDVVMLMGVDVSPTPQPHKQMQHTQRNALSFQAKKDDLRRQSVEHTEERAARADKAKQQERSHQPEQ
jgi:membrane protein involved in colicin uptake